MAIPRLAPLGILTKATLQIPAESLWRDEKAVLEEMVGQNGYPEAGSFQIPYLGDALASSKTFPPCLLSVCLI